MNIIQRFINLGAHRQADIASLKYLRFTNSVALIVILFLFQNAAMAIMNREESQYHVLFLHFIGIALIPYFNFIGKRLFAAAWFSSVALIFVTFYAHVYTLESLNFVFLTMIIFLQFFMFSKAESAYIIFFTTISVICFVGVIAWEMSGNPPIMTVSQAYIRAQRINTFIGMPLLSIAFGYYAYYTIHSAEREADIERDKTERLLLNILPSPIAQRFRNDQSFFAERFESASVLFADIVGFTNLSEKISPDDLVYLLNEVFSKYDALTEEHGLEKIKTIGDAYMVAGGIINPTPDHVLKICSLALKMREAIRNIKSPGEPMQVRIGICCGPVTAGVIGVKKFIYDLWGDTVNTASRMQSHAPENGIQITESVYKIVKNDFRCEPRGIVNVRGKGDMNTYLLLA